MADIINPNITEEKRKRQLAILKASNELLRESKEKALKHNEGDNLKIASLELEFGKAIEDNNAQARNYLHATMDEVENSEYREASKGEIEKYKHRLEVMGKTDEEMHNKMTAYATTSKTKTKKNDKARRQRLGSKKDVVDDEIVRLDNEEEIMKSMMVKDEKDIENNIKRKEEYLKTRRKRYNNKMANIEDDFIEIMKPNKVNSVDETKIKRAEVKNEVKKENKKETNAVAQTTEASVIEKTTKKHKEKAVEYDFNFADIPSWVQYDVIPLPSNGECYPKDNPLRCGHIPVAYLTAADENIMASPNVYRDGKLLDIILERKILDKRINVKDLCSGDRDAIILWLRATSYGEDFPIVTTNPENGKRYNLTIKLSQFDYLDFDLEGDDDGLFTYETENGDIIKFKFLTNEDEEHIKDEIASEMTDYNKLNTIKAISNLEILLAESEVSDEEREMLNEDIGEIKEIVGTDIKDIDETVYPNIVTEQMTSIIKSVNDNTDTEFIHNYVDNMRTKEAMKLRNYVSEHKPGVDFRFDVNIPESDGGGSYTTFLTITDTIFINV